MANAIVVQKRKQKMTGVFAPFNDPVKGPIQRQLTEAELLANIEEVWAYQAASDLLNAHRAKRLMTFGDTLRG